MKKFYVTTSIAYVNAVPHIGFGMELVQADVLARYHRLRGSETMYLTGTDEHGVKIYRTAADQGVTAQELADANSGRFRELTKALSISNDHFIRTTDVSHMHGAQEMWRRMFASGDIYKGSYEGLYCVGCEAYVLEKDLVDGNCVMHKKAPELLKEENYFFRLSKYSNRIRDLIASDKLLILPDARKNEILNIIGEGLPDVSFSRPQSMLPWGIPVPEDESQVMYVWCDALSNYLTGVGFPDDVDRVSRLWPADVHLIGKDILRFHAGVWIGMLLSAGISVPRAVYVHGFITSEGQKMSKSLGNVVDPFVYISEFGADALRYYLLKEIPTTDDGDFSRERFTSRYQVDLGNNLGNLVYRVLSMTEKYFDGVVPTKIDSQPFTEGDSFSSLADAVSAYENAIDGFDLKVALEIVWKLVDIGNVHTDRSKPWSLAKENPEKLKEVIYQLLELIRVIGVLVLPFLPSTGEKILHQCGYDDVKIKGVSFDRDAKWGCFLGGEKITKSEPLFPRHEEK